tara:strand:- start:5571 stop:5819 length:249 start_codon:yes stop_codon:yes gene_type:complete
MPTNLNYIIKRNKSSLKNFIDKNRLTSYADLVEYCRQRNFVPCTEEEYIRVVGSKNEKKEKLERKTSKPQKKRKARASSKSK